MPTKLGKGGAGMQDYVPAGHSAGGQYGDNESGSNKNFKTFKKPEKKEDSIGIEAKGDSKIVYNGKEYTQEETKEILKKSMGVKHDTINVTRVLDQLYSDNVDPKIRSLVLDTLATGNYRVTAIKNGRGYFSYGGEIHFNSTDNPAYTKCEVFLHEVGHAIDHSYSDGELYSKDYVSTKYGKTMLQMKNEELGQFLDNGGFKKIMEEYHRDEKTPELEKLENLRDSLYKVVEESRGKIKSSEEYQALENEYDNLINKLYSGEIDFSTYYQQKNSISRQMDEMLNAGVDNETYQAYKKASYEYDTKYSENLYKLAQKYMDLSDMCQAWNKKYKFCGGHDSSYFIGDRVHQATECFAEIQSALGSNSASLEVLQRYIPKTIEIYKEIIEGLKNGK